MLQNKTVLDMLQTTEQKLDELMSSIQALSASQKAIQHQLDEKFKKLEEDVVSFLEDAMERALKQARQYCPLEFRRKVHEEQYLFNAEVGDRIESAAKKISTSSDKEVKVLCIMNGEAH